MIAATYGPSTAIMSHVAASGAQNARTVRVRSGGVLGSASVTNVWISRGMNASFYPVVKKRAGARGGGCGYTRKRSGRPARRSTAGTALGRPSADAGGHWPYRLGGRHVAYRGDLVGGLGAFFPGGTSPCSEIRAVWVRLRSRYFGPVEFGIHPPG